MSEKVKSTVDWASVSLGLAAIIINLAISAHSGCAVILKTAVIWTAALVCLGYVVYAVRLCLNMADFDWNLINGHFLRKVCCIVLLIPSLLTVTGQFFIDSPKELADERGLYEYHDYQANDVDNLQKSPDIFWGTYYHFIDPGNQHMTSTKAARVWTAIIAILGVFLLNGLLVSSIVGWIDKRKEEWLKGSVRYDRLLGKTSHYVIIGGNDMVPGIVSELLDVMQNTPGTDTAEYILIQTSRDVESFRRELFSTLTIDQQQKIIIYYGNRNSEADIRVLCLETAKEVYVLGEESRTDDLESYHDTMNMECLKMLHEEYLKHNLDKSLICRVLFEYQTTFSIFQFSDIEKSIDFRPFNYYEMWAQKVLVNKTLDRSVSASESAKGGYLPLEGIDGINADSNKHVHLFVVGMSRMGVAMAIEAAHLAHCPNFESKGIRTKITFIDKNADEEKDFFIGRFKELFTLSNWRFGKNDGGRLIWEKEHAPVVYDYLGGDFIDVEWEFIDAGIESSVVQDYIYSCLTPSTLGTIAICLPESNRSHASALYLSKEIFESESLLQVLVYNRYGDAIVKSLISDRLRHPYLNKMKSFGMPKECFDAKYLEQSETIGNAVGSRYLTIEKEYINPAKEKANQVDKVGVAYKGKSRTAKMWSNIYNGNMLWTKLRCIGFDPVKGLSKEQVEVLSDVEHNRWNMEQLLMHFRPLTKEEQDAVIARKKDKDDLKGEMAHLNICSNKRLLELKNVDVAARAYDIGLTELLPEIYSQINSIK